jgi:hypothetical protein
MVMYVDELHSYSVSKKLERALTEHREQGSGSEPDGSCETRRET